MASAISHHGRPIALPSDPAALEVAEQRAFEQLWRRERDSLNEQQAVKAFNERMARWWSIETGIIERLYDLSEDITVQLVNNGFEASLIPMASPAFLPRSSCAGEHRLHQGGAVSAAGAPMTVAAEPLLLSADENEQAQRDRFRAWLEAARNAALAQWTKFL